MPVDNKVELVQPASMTFYYQFAEADIFLRTP